MLSILDTPERKSVGFHWQADFSRLPDRIDDPLVQDQIFKLTHTVSVQIAQDLDNALADAIIAAAREEGIDEVFILDRKFCLDAIREKIERMTGGSQNEI